MKKKLFVIIFFSIVLILYATKSYGSIISFTDEDKKIELFSIGYSSSAAIDDGNRDTLHSKILRILKEDYGYETEQEKVCEEMKFKTTIKVKKQDKGTCTFGTSTKKVTLKKDRSSVIPSWLGDDQSAAVYIVVKMEDVIKDDLSTVETGKTTRNYYINGTLKKLYVGSEDSNHDGTTDLEVGEQLQLDSPEMELYGEVSVQDFVQDKVNSAINTFLDGLAGTWNFLRNFFHNPMGTVATIILDVVRTIFGDVPQLLTDMIQTSILGTLSDLQILYKYNDLVADKNGTYGDNIEAAGNRDMYTNVGGYQSEGREDWQKNIEVDGDEFGFTADTEIPVIPVDQYNLAIGNVGFTDANFFEINTENGTPWLIIRNFAVALTHVTLYLSAAALLTSLIWHGVHVVKLSINNPQKRADHMQGLQRFAISVLMLVGTIVIMALSIYASNIFVQDIRDRDGNELPIRVNVSGGENGLYSFSTNGVGYLKYMSQIDDVDKALEKAVYTIPYIINALWNCVSAIVMVIRMFMLFGLAIAGPVCAVVYAWDLKKIPVATFNVWVKLYVSLSSAQIILAIISRIIFECIE